MAEVADEAALLEAPERPADRVAVALAEKVLVRRRLGERGEREAEEKRYRLQAALSLRMVIGRTFNAVTISAISLVM